MKTHSALIFLAAALSIVPAVSSERNPKSIYHKGWIDFNKNGKKDIYEDPAQPVEKRVADLLSQMTPEEKSCQLATLYGYGRVLADSLPVEKWKDEVWKDGIANIDEQLNGVGKGFRTSLDLIWPFSNHVRALRQIQQWFVEETRLGIPVEFSNEAIHGLNHTKATPLPAPVAIGKHMEQRAGAQSRENSRRRGGAARLSQHICADSGRCTGPEMGTDPGMLWRRPVPRRRTRDTDGRRHSGRRACRSRPEALRRI